ncbi:DUF1289 domain-containing protein [Tepidamorphus sp. 3E244]|uniref:DUF1289 domain-containing protein n=1 Tax=Tepidamorphus sp. 3E244 TaxID=3385498 RepID=UPI0038FC9D77
MTAFQNQPGRAKRAEKIETPCIDICRIDPERRLCRGCGRTMDEIAGWVQFTPQQRADIMAVLPDRLKGKA